MPGELLTYEDTFEIIIPLKASESAQPGDWVLQGSLRYQACDARSCLFPASVSVSLPVRVISE